MDTNIITSQTLFLTSLVFEVWGFHGGENVDLGLLGYDTMWSLGSYLCEI
jgi:hypothetical protein